MSYDVIIVGGGITGLNTAIALKEAKQDLDIVVLERGLMPSGASTRNAGFACFGSPSELLQDVEALGEDGMVRLVERRWKGLLKMRDRLGDNQIDFIQNGGYELLFEGDKTMEHMDRLNSLLKPVFGSNTFENRTSEIGTKGFSGVRQLAYSPFEGQVDTGKMCRALIAYCQRLGITILTGANVTDVQATGVSIDDLHINAKAVALCTNAFTPALTSADLKPGRGVVLVVEPRKQLPFQGIYHYEQGYYYFRDYHGRLLYGGGRNLDPEAETTTETEINQVILTHLIEQLGEVILPGTPHDIVHQWAGIMAFGDNKAPIVQETTDGIYLGVRLGGMGVAIGSLVGMELSELILKKVF